MISQKMQDALNAQLNAEFYSAYLYLSMSNYFESIGLKGLAHWMRMQWEEEQVHTLKLNDFINERGGRVMLTAVDGPPTDWASPLAVFEVTAEHEFKVTGLINDLVNVATEESDHATRNFLMWFVEEQVEEEASVDEVLSKLKLIGDSGQGLFMLDEHLGLRTPPAPATPAEG